MATAPCAPLKVWVFLKAIYRNHCGSRVSRKSGKITATRSARRPREPNSGSLKFPLSPSPSLPPLPLRGCSPGGRAVPRYVPLPAAPAGPGRGRGSTPPRLPAGAHACRRRRRAACLPARLQAAAAAARSGTGRARRGGGGGAAAAARRRRRPALIYRAGRGAHPRRTTPLFKRFQ